ncbi:MAG: hypothetical protein LC679_06860 [Intrasporangiaceae bacterium]|nr:hypothetical protein [Intrasporangiaceae bacterium]
MKPREPNPRPKADVRGRHIEDRLRVRLRDAKNTGRLHQYMQPDAVVSGRDGQLFFVEAKGQSAFKAPPFDGHGLPRDQALRYMFIFELYGIRTQLIVWDDNTCWWQWIDALEQGQHFDTSGTIKTVRRIYPLSSFVRADAWHDGKVA